MTEWLLSLDDEDLGQVERYIIARLEAGNISPSLPTLDKIAAALGAEVSLTIVDMDELAAARPIAALYRARASDQHRQTGLSSKPTSTTTRPPPSSASAASLPR